MRDLYALKSIRDRCVGVGMKRIKGIKEDVKEGDEKVVGVVDFLFRKLRPEPGAVGTPL